MTKYNSRKIREQKNTLFPVVYFLTAILCLGSFKSFAVIDTLRNHNPATSNSSAFISTTKYPSQYACFELPAPGYIKSLVITLGGSASMGSATVHVLGHEGGSPYPFLENDIMPPVIINKSIAGNENIVVDLPTPVKVDNNLFFIKVDNFSPNITLIKDLTSHAPFCSSASGGEYYMQLAKDAGGNIVPFLNAFVIDVVMDYTEGLTSPQYMQDITAAAGISANLSNRYISWADINKDGYLDLLVSGKLYKNNGNLTFTDITSSSGIASSGVSTFMDMNNDGKEDILFLSGGGANNIYINNGDETFTKNTLIFTTPNFVSFGAFSIGDFNNDSYPDLFVGQLWKNDTQGNEQYYNYNLYLNDKNLGFTDTSSAIVPSYIYAETLPGPNVTNSPYKVGTTRAVRGAQCVDYNDDGKLDLYIANYRLQQDDLWRNNGDGTFTNVCRSSGIEPVIGPQGEAGHGTGCDWADYDNDGDMDLLLPQLAHPWYIKPYDMRPTSIFRNNGAPSYDFTDMNPGANKGNIGIEYEETHAGANWGDLNNDGLLDFGISAFYGCRYADIYLQKPDHTFELKSFEFGVKDIVSAQELVFVDIDNDGKLDMSYGVNEGEFRLFKNNGPFHKNYVELDLESTSGNKSAVGAKVVVYAGGKAYTQYQMPYHGAFMSKGNRIHVGLGYAPQIDSVIVRWPNGSLNSEKFTGVAINNLNTLIEGGTVKVDTFQTTIYDGVGVKEEHDILSDLTVYPNPASSELFFKYSLSSTETVSLEIYSILGDKNTLIANEKQTSGQHIVQWNIKDKIAPGLYVYCFRVGELQKTGKIIVR